MGGNLSSLNGGKAVDTSQNSGGMDFDPMPPGWYACEIEKEELKQTNDNTGVYLWLQLSVVGDHYKGKKLFPKFNLQNKSAKAVEIAQRELGDLGNSVGLPVLEDSKQLLGKFVDVRVKIEPAKGDYPADNKITAYAPVGTKSSETPAASAPAKTAAPAKKAWDKPPEGNAAPAQPATATASSAPAQAASTPATAPAKAKRPWEK